jgi:hypothetical protein
VTRWRSAATADEDAELRALSEQAEEARQELADTAAALARKMASEADVRAWGRRLAADAATGLGHAALDAARRPAVAGGRISARARDGLGRSGYARVAVIVTPVMLVAAGLALYAMRQRAAGHR